jgi:hypothetical protein
MEELSLKLIIMMFHATYPIAPLNSGISAYGNQNGYTLDLNNPYATVGTVKTPILEMLSTISPVLNTGAGTASLTWGKIPPLTIIFFMGSTIYLTSVTSTFLTASADNNSNMFIPYYCPRFPTGYMPSSGSPTVGNRYALPFPLVMAAYATMGVLTTALLQLIPGLQYAEGTGANKNVKVLIEQICSLLRQSYSKTSGCYCGTCLSFC